MTAFARNLFLGAVLAASALQGSGSAQAADQDDIYLSGYVGTRLDRSREIGIAGAVLGYLLVDSIGIGFLYDQIFPIQSSARGEDTGPLVGIEARWFLEPFEVNLAFAGLLSDANTNRSVFLGGGTYLLALTPSLAARAELRAQYLSSGKTQFTTNLGFRLLL